MTNCEWFNSKMEAYFCDALNPEEQLRFQGHLASCAECRQQVEALNNIDPLVRGVLQHRLAIAQAAVHTNGRPHLVKYALTAGALAAAAFVFAVGLQFFQNTPPVPVAVQPPAEVESPVEPGIKKNSTDGLDINLGKPLDGPPVKPAPQPELDEVRANGPEFSVIDAAGYTATLETYRGRVFLFAVVSPAQKTAVNNLEQVYEMFGANGRVGVLGVARHREDEFRGTKFPVFFNNGSRLLGVQEGQFMLLDAAGKSRLQGSLADAASVTRIRSELGQLGIR